jgi:protein tyrosine/serine phosphatase
MDETMESVSVDPVGSGLENFRDLGGIRTSWGGRVRYGVLYRSDVPRAGDPAPPACVWPPTTVIDLRSGEEVDTSHPFTGSAREIHSIALLGETRARSADGAELGQVPLETMYGQAVARLGRTMAAIAGLIAHSDGPTLIHCTVGKDRTGLVVATVLAAVGCSDEEIVADYVRTEDNMPRVLARLANQEEPDGGAALVARLARENPAVLAAPAAAIEAALEALHDAGGAAAWLARNGLSATELMLLRERLTEPLG